MRVITFASQVVEIIIPDDLAPEDVSDFVVNEIRKAYLGDWDLLGWEKIEEVEENRMKAQPLTNLQRNKS
jgi:hypothetical protein